MEQITARHSGIKEKVKVPSISSVRFSTSVLSLLNDYRKLDLSNRVCQQPLSSYKTLACYVQNKNSTECEEQVHTSMEMLVC